MGFSATDKLKNLKLHQNQYHPNSKLWADFRPKRKPLPEYFVDESSELEGKFVLLNFPEFISQNLIVCHWLGIPVNSEVIHYGIPCNIPYYNLLLLPWPWIGFLLPLAADDFTNKKTQVITANVIPVTLIRATTSTRVMWEAHPSHYQKIAYFMAQKWR